MNKREMRRIFKRAQKRARRGTDEKRHDRVKGREQKDIKALFAFYQWQGVKVEEAMLKVAKDLTRDPKTVKRHLQGAAQPGEQARGKPEVGQVHSLAQLAHFGDVQGHIQRWGVDLGAWSVENLWYGLAKGKEVLFIEGMEQSPYFPVVKGHLVEPLAGPAFWKWWEELKVASAPFETKLRGLWEGLKAAREAAGLAFILLPQEWDRPQEGITADFFLTILYEQEGNPNFQGSFYQEGSVSYLEDSNIWASIEEGLARLRGEQPSKDVRAVIAINQGGVRITSADATVIERLPQPVKRPLEVRFFLRYGCYGGPAIAFVYCPNELPRVREAHEQAREVYGPRLRELIASEKQPRGLIEQFQKHLSMFGLHSVFPGRCPYCPA